jgi:hypothetical protein
LKEKMKRGWNRRLPAILLVLQVARLGGCSARLPKVSETRKRKKMMARPCRLVAAAF